MKKLNTAQLDELIEALVGTMDDLQNAMDELFGEGYSEKDLTVEDHDYINSRIFLCKSCEWWIRVDETAATEALVDYCLDCRNLMN